MAGPLETPPLRCLCGGLSHGDAPTRILPCKCKICDRCLSLLLSIEDRTISCPFCPETWNRDAIETQQVAYHTPPPSGAMKCELHTSKEIVFYCETCKQPCCIVCCKQHHTGHDYHDIADAVQNTRESHLKNTEALQREVHQKIEETTRSVHSLAKHCEEVNNTLTTVEQALAQAFERAHLKVDYHKQAEHNKLQQHLTTLLATEKNLQERVDQLKALVGSDIGIVKKLHHITTDMPSPPPTPAFTTLSMVQIPLLKKRFEQLADKLNRVLISEAPKDRNSSASCECSTCCMPVSEHVLAIIQKMHNHADDPAVQAKGCQSLKTLAKVDKGILQVITHGGIQAIISAMQRHSACYHVQESGCHALRTVAKYYEATKPIMDGEAIDMVTAAMTLHPHCEIQLHGCKLLSIIPLTPQLCDRIVGKAAVPLVVKAMERYFEISKPLQIYGCSALSKLAQSSNGKQQILDNRGVDAVFKAVTTYGEDPKVVSAAFAALANIPLNAVKVPDIIDKTIKLVIRNLERHAAHASVQQHGCGVLANLVRKEEKANEEKPNEEKAKEAKCRVLQNRGVDLVLTAMRNHPTQADLQDSACLVLRKLAKDAAIKELMSHEQIAKLVLAAMKRHRSHSSLQANGCALLALLSDNTNKAFPKHLREGVKAVVAAMTHNEHRDVQRNGCDALQNFARFKTDIGEEAWHDAVQPVVTAMINYPNDEDILWRGCYVLWLMAASKNAREQITRQDGIDRIIKSMENHLDREALQWTGCAALAAIAEGSEYTAKVISHGGIKIVLAAIQHHSENANVIAHGCNALRRMAEVEHISESIKQREEYLKVVSDVICALHIHGKRGDLVAHAVCLLSLLAVNEQARRLIADQSGIATLLRVMRKFHEKVNPYAEEVVMDASTALESLTIDHSNLREIANQKGVKTILRAMSNFENDTLLVSCCTVLKRILAVSESSEQVLNILCGDEHLVDILRKCSKSTNKQLKSLAQSLLRQISNTPRAPANVL